MNYKLQNIDVLIYMSFLYNNFILSLKYVFISKINILKKIRYYYLSS